MLRGGCTFFSVGVLLHFADIQVVGEGGAWPG